MNNEYFDVLIIDNNLDIVNIIQTMTQDKCLGTLINKELIKLYFKQGQRNEVENIMKSLKTDNSYIYKWDTLEKEDWHLAWKDYFQPINIDNKLKIIPDWYNTKTNKSTVIIKPGMAFGTGHHETTWLVLKQMLDYVKPNMKVLDLGAGSGILSIAAIKLGALTVDAVEHDINCKSNFFENINLNNIDKKIKFYNSDAQNWHNFNYDLIIANINQNIIKNLIPNFYMTNANIILSGILAEKFYIIENLLNNINFKIIHKDIKNEWISIITNKK